MNQCLKLNSKVLGIDICMERSLRSYLGQDQICESFTFKTCIIIITEVQSG